MGQDLLVVLGLLTKLVCCAENEQIMSTESIKFECLYQHIMNSLKAEGHFVMKLFSLLFGWLHNESIVECKLDVASDSKINMIG